MAHINFTKIKTKLVNDMNEASLNERDAKGQWQPRILPNNAPLYKWPPKPASIINWLFEHLRSLFPWKAFIMLIPICTWFFLTPDLIVMKTFEIEWITIVFIRNIILLTIIAGGLHLLFYIRKAQGTKYKYNEKWPDKSRRFLFGDQTRDNVFWSIASGCSVWTFFEVITYWLFANNKIGFLNWSDSPVYFTLLYFAIDPIRQLHFDLTHRLLHWEPLYKLAHYLHHKNTNFGPWSGLSMHPIEHLIYFSGVVLHWVLLSHPLHALWHLQNASFTAPIGHSGFENMEIIGRFKIKGPGDYHHYLHHRYFECNYGTPELPFDSWFGTFNDGSVKAHKDMRKKRKQIHG